MNFATKVWYPGSHSGCVLAGSKYYPVITRPTGSLLQKKTCWKRRLDVGLPFPVSVGTFPTALASGKLGEKHELQASPSSRVLLSAHNMLEKPFSFIEENASTESVFQASNL